MGRISERFPSMAKAYRSRADVLKAEEKACKSRADQWPVCKWRVAEFGQYL
jgi:hypothetical protein